MKRIFMVALLVCVASSGWATGSVTGILIDNVRVDATGKGIVHFFVPLGGTATTCSTSGFKQDLGFDTNTDAGRAVFSMLLAAKVGGAKVTALGTGTCVSYSGVEDWNYGSIQ